MSNKPNYCKWTVSVHIASDTCKWLCFSSNSFKLISEEWTYQGKSRYVLMFFFLWTKVIFHGQTVSTVSQNVQHKSNHQKTTEEIWNLKLLRKWRGFLEEVHCMDNTCCRPATESRQRKRHMKIDAMHGPLYWTVFNIFIQIFSWRENWRDYIYEPYKRKCYCDNGVFIM